MHKKVYKVEKTVVEPGVNISQIAKGPPSETGNLRGTAYKHDILVKLLFHIGRSDAFSVHKKQACPRQDDHRNDVPVVLFFTELASIVL
jgi:hypothetical protein